MYMDRFLEDFITSKVRELRRVFELRYPII